MEKDLMAYIPVVIESITEIRTFYISASHRADWPTCTGVSRFNDPQPRRGTGHRKDISGTFIEAAAVPRS
ncbi:hypothetical protein E2C01_028190 [Portunus trituberculatus]|uniref:Uncharacterized protein n=1 Tax=Portunus trituberculatus TaxID=210409 RepID=A0A5B7ENN9_PORTR|nr:hypothetical protein [Portunus trituberculatus]